MPACGNDDFPNPNSPTPAPSGTPEARPTLRLVVDVKNTLPDMEEVLRDMPRDFDLEVEDVPREGAERANALSRVRTEMLAGKGPDLFVCSNSLDNPGDGIVCDALFRFPRKAMENHLFLPLDEYVESARYMEWDKLLPQIMEAGKNEEGQMLIPMAYEPWIYLLEASQYTPGFQYPITWQELAESPDPGANLAARLTSMMDIVGDPAQPDKDEPSITEEELLDLVERNLEIRDAPLGDLRPLVSLFGEGVFKAYRLLETDNVNWVELEDTDYVFLTGSTRSGGLAVDITTFTAVNRNTQHPDEAFQVIDYLLSREIQSERYYQKIQGIPVHMDLFTEDLPLHGQWMNDWNLQQFHALQERIGPAKFLTPADAEVQNVLLEAILARQDGKDMETVVHNGYRKLQMILAES